MVSPTESLSIAEIAIYAPLLLANIFVLIRHGASKQSGWIFLSIFCLTRIIGAGFGIASGVHQDNTSDFEWSIILGSIGISPLLLATMGLLKRIIDETSTRNPHESGNQPAWQKYIRYIPIVGQLYHILYASRATATSYRSKIIQLLAIPTLVALIIGIVGGTDRTSSSASDQRMGTTLTKAALIIYVVIYVCVFLLAAKSASEFNVVPGGERRILAVVLFALPLLAVRILYSLIAYLGHISNFSILNNSADAVLVRTFMSILEEFLIVIAYTTVGLMVTPAYEPQRDPEDYNMSAHRVRKTSMTQQPNNS